MAVVAETRGRSAVTRYRVERRFGAGISGSAALLECRLLTGRTHQIRVHLAHVGAPCLGDPVYGAGAAAPAVRAAMAQAGLARQALHAAVLGFVHPITGQALRFGSGLPEDMARLAAALENL
jgi:23S rRNA pseudouridine1911/1915/1917 synthase